MPIVAANGMDIAYVENGDRSGPAILLIMGLGMQLIAWPDEFCEGLARRGFRVVRFDNRDVGLSTKARGGGAIAVAAAFASALAGLPVAAPYLLSDMARDAIGLMDALGIERAHIVGASMGGMIAQIIAAERPERVLSLTLIMSSSGDPDLPRSDPRLIQALFLRRFAFTRERAVRQAMRFYRLIASPGFPTSQEQLRAKVERSVDRCYYPAGVGRHLLAILASGSRVAMLGRIRAPTLVLHGADDIFVPVEAGRDTAARIPGARLRIIPGMGHDLAPGLIPILVEAIAEHCTAAAEVSGRGRPARSMGGAR